MSTVNIFLHTDKTECVLFGTSCKLASTTNFNIYIYGDIIKHVFDYKYLGVVMDECLSWEEHIKYILKKASKRVGALGRVRRNITTHAANLMYK